MWSQDSADADRRRENRERVARMRTGQYIDPADLPEQGLASRAVAEMTTRYRSRNPRVYTPPRERMDSRLSQQEVELNVQRDWDDDPSSRFALQLLQKERRRLV